MKLTDKRFWKFEVMMLLCGFMLLCQIVVMLICNGAEIEACGGAVLILLLPALCIYFAISGIPAWLLYKGNSWLRLAGWQYLFSAVLLIVMLLIFFYDWNPASASVRPEDIYEDEVKYITDNELVIIIGVGWTVFLIVPVLMASYLTKRWIVKKVSNITNYETER